MSEKLGKLEDLIGYKFQNPELLERAVTHRSWAYENFPGETDEAIREAENESLEFVGDSVLGLVIAEELFRKNPTFDEGDLTLMKHHLVSTGTLARIAQNLELGKFIRVGRGEEKTGGRSKLALLANTLEAVIAAVFFDTGYIAARDFVRNVFAEELASANPKSSLDYKTMLQEILQSEKLSAPAYNVIRTEGQPHARTFFVEAIWKTGRSRGRGSSIKSAEMMAASEALKTLEQEKMVSAKRKAKK